MAKEHLKPGQTAPVSGIYGIINKNGTATGAQRTVDKGETIPPTPKKGQTYIIKVKTKTK
jgi:hypothetical protein